MTGPATLDPGFIERAMQLPRSQDYAYLRARGLRYIQRLGHGQWTDYNVHDPGVTMLELLCYAITDVGMRAAYPMGDLLAPIGPASTSDFHLANQVLVSRPVSFDDLRRVLIDIPGVRNAWVERHTGVTYALDTAHNRLVGGVGDDSITLNGLFDVFLQYEDFVAPGDPQYRAQTTVGLTTPDATVEYIGAAYRGLEFQAMEDARLESVTIFPGQAGTLMLRLKHRDDVVAQHPVTITAAEIGTAVVVSLPVQFILKSGLVYRLGCTDATAVTLRRTKMASFPMPAPAANAPIRMLRGFTPGSTPDAGRNSYYFYYSLRIAHDSSGLTEREVRAAAIERIHQNRNLCEDVINVCKLEPEEIAVCADLELRPDADTDAVHAEILYRLHRFLSPTVPFHSLEELRARGKSIDEIFEGPVLGHGFIDGDELKAIRRRCEIHASDVVQILMDIDGVVAVKSLKLLKVADLLNPVEWILPLSANRIATFAPWQSKLTFYKRGLPYLTNPKSVRPLFERKKAADVEDKLLVRTRELPAPAGEWRNTGAYEAVVNELPITYRVGRIVVPDSDPVRQAQSRQLTAYLLFFDQMLANYLAQLSHIGELFTWRDVDFRSYFTQRIGGISGLEPVTLPGGIVVPGALDNAAAEGFASFNDALQAIVESPATAAARRLQFLEHLVARYAEEFDEYKAMMRGFIRAAITTLPAWNSGTAYSIGARVADNGIEYECVQATSATDRRPRELPAKWRQQSRLIRQLRRFLEDYPAISANRGGGFDWRRPFDPANVAGYQHRVYRMLDIDPVVRAEFAGHRFVILDAMTADGRVWHFELRDEDDHPLLTSVPCKSKSSIESLLDLALRLGADRANYKVNTAGTTQLVQICDDTHEPDPLGDLTAGASLTDVIAYFKQIYENEGFHVIEHILLRRRTVADPFLPVQLFEPDECCPAVRDPYSFRVSIVLPSWSPRFRDMKFRRLVEDTLRREAPAHVYPRICWVNHEQMKNLEIALANWQDGLASLGREAGACAADDGSFTGRLPLPPADADYAALLSSMIDELYHLTNVYPLAQIHDCEEVDGDTPQITLGNTSLGTL